MRRRLSMLILHPGAIKWPINQKAFFMVWKAFDDGSLTPAPAWQNGLLGQIGKNMLFHQITRLLSKTFSFPQRIQMFHLYPVTYWFVFAAGWHKGLFRDPSCGNWSGENNVLSQTFPCQSPPDSVSFWPGTPFANPTTWKWCKETSNFK